MSIPLIEFAPDRIKRLSVAQKTTIDATERRF